MRIMFCTHLYFYFTLTPTWNRVYCIFQHLPRCDTTTNIVVKLLGVATTAETGVANLNKTWIPNCCTHRVPCYTRNSKVQQYPQHHNKKQKKCNDQSIHHSQLPFLLQPHIFVPIQLGSCLLLGLLQSTLILQGRTAPKMHRIRYSHKHESLNNKAFRSRCVKPNTKKLHTCIKGKCLWRAHTCIHTIDLNIDTLPFRIHPVSHCAIHI